MDAFTEQIDALDYRPAVVATGVWIGIGLALDAYLLVKRKDRLISDVLRTRPGRAVLIVFGLHVANCLGKADPFSAAAAAINWRLAATAAGAAVGAVVADATTPVPTALTDALPGE